MVKTYQKRILFLDIIEHYNTNYNINHLINN